MTRLITEEDRVRGVRIKNLREARGLTRVQLASRCGIGCCTLGEIETASAMLLDNTPRRYERVKRLAGALGVTVQHLMYGSYPAVDE